MKNIFFPVFLIATCCTLFFGCSKNKPYVSASNPTMTADIGTFKFIASTVKPATIDTQIVDTSTTLEITGFSSDRVSPQDKIVLYIANFKAVTGTFSIVQGQAGAVYYHAGILDVATGGIVSVTSVSSTTITGYFNFNTAEGVAVTGGKYTVNRP